MKTNLTIRTAALLVATIVPAGPAAAQFVGTVIASGLNNPRGLEFGPDGALWIAEAGVVQVGGPTTIIERGGVSNVFHLSDTGSITRLMNGVQERLITGLASIGSTTINETTGPQDIAFSADGTGYTVIGFLTDPAVRFTDLAPGGENLGQIFTFTGGAPAPFADVAALEAANPAGRELNSNPYHMAPLADGGLLVTDAGSNTLIRVGADGSFANLATFFARPNGAPPGLPQISDSVPTGIAVGPDGNYYVAELTGFPFIDGSAQIHRVTPTGDVTLGFYTGFTNITDIAFGADGSLYVLELDSNGLFTPGGGGQLIRVAADGTQETIFSEGLVTPTGLAIGADGAFYVTNFSAAEGIGTVIRIAAVPEPASWAMMIAGFGLIGGAMRRRSALATA